MADQKSLKLLGFGFASVTAAVMLLTMLVVEKHIASIASETPMVTSAVAMLAPANNQ